MQHFIRVAGILVCYLVFFGLDGRAADERELSDKLPEPALQFAKEAGLRLLEQERAFLKLSEEIKSNQVYFNIAVGGQSDSSLRTQAERLLSSAKKLLSDYKQIGTDLERFKDSLKRAASNYRELAGLYRGHAAKAQAAEVKDDYLQLARVYEAKATSAEERSKKLSVPAKLAPAASVIEEGNVFVDRLLELLSIGPVSETDRGIFAGRLKKHGERCQALVEDSLQALEKALDGAEAAGGKRKSASFASPTTKGTNLKSSSGEHGTQGGRSEQAPLFNTSWSTPVTIKGQQCLHVIRLNVDGTFEQSLYLSGPKGAGKLLASGRGTFEVDIPEILSFFQGTKLIERGRILSVGRDEWVYEILENPSAPEATGRRITFKRK